VDWNVTDRQHVSFRYNANRFTGVNYENTGSTSASEHTGNSSVATDNTGFIYTNALTPNSLIEGRFFYTRDHEPGEANSTAPETVINQNGQRVIAFGRNSFSPRFTNIDTYQPTATYSVTKGAHTVKVGADLIFQQIGNYFPGNFAGSYVFNSYDAFGLSQPFSFTQAFAGPNTTGATSYPNVNEYAMFAQDSWRVGRKLTLNYGARYDYFDYAQPNTLNPDPTDQRRFEECEPAVRVCVFAYRRWKDGTTRRVRLVLWSDAFHLYRHGFHSERDSGSDVRV
jgi:outer membrane receptor for ferrienterochelin and colicin